MRRQAHVVLEKILRLSFVFGFLLIGGCDNFVLYDTLEPDSLAQNSTSDPLAIVPANVAVTVKEQVSFAAAGGKPEYRFSITSGGGSIEADTGLYTAPAQVGGAAVRVSDSLNNTASAIVTIVAAEQLQIYPSSLTINAGGSYTFSASGGVPPYSFVLSTNESGGTIDTSTGQYTAGPTDGTTDQITVTDEANSVATASATVVSGGALGISPENPLVEEGGTVQFSAYGGNPAEGYTYSAVAGTIDSTTGLYTAFGLLPGEYVGEVFVDNPTGGTVATTVYVAPAAPTNLVVNGSTGDPKTITVTWVDNSAGEDGYVIERKTNASGDTFQQVDTAGADGTSFSDGGLSPNVLYIYRVYAYSNAAAGLQSDYSNEDYDFSNS